MPTNQVSILRVAHWVNVPRMWHVALLTINRISTCVMSITTWYRYVLRPCLQRFGMLAAHQHGSIQLPSVAVGRYACCSSSSEQQLALSHREVSGVVESYGLNTSTIEYQSITMSSSILLLSQTSKSLPGIPWYIYVEAEKLHLQYVQSSSDSHVNSIRLLYA